MHATISRRLAVALLLGATAATAARAQTAPASPPTRIRGTIKSLDGNVLSVTTREGPVVQIKLNDGFTVASLKKLALTDITKGSYIGTAAEPGPDGELVALEVLVFPEANRGAGEGHYAWDLTPKTTMTNANVEASVQGNAGNVLTLTHKNGTTKVRVPPGVPIVTPQPAAKEDLQPGRAIFSIAAKAADGTLSTGRVTVEKDGVAPPM